MLSYRVILDVPLPLAVFVPGLLAAHRRELGTRDGTRALTCWKQAVFTLACGSSSRGHAHVVMLKGSRSRGHAHPVMLPWSRLAPPR